MNRTRNIFRLAVICLSVFLLVDINRKSNDNRETIAEFKFKMFQNVQTDSLDSKQKLDLVINETTKFVDDSSKISRGIQHLTILFALVIVAELVFFLRAKRE